MNSIVDTNSKGFTLLGALSFVEERYGMEARDRVVEALDADGTLCPLADNSVRFKVEGPAEIAGVGNGNPLSLEPFQSDSRKLFYGKAMLILRTRDRQAGRVHVTAESDSLAPAEITVQCR